MATLARGAALITIGVSLAGCATSSPPPVSPLQTLKASLAAFVAAPSLFMQGTAFLDGVPYQVNLQEDGDLQAAGYVTLDGQRVGVDWTGGQLFLNGGDYFAQAQVTTGTRWVLTHGDKLQPVLMKVANRKELADAVLQLAGRNVTRSTAGRAITADLSNDRVSVTVPLTGGPPVRLATAVDQPLSDGLSDLKLTITSSASGPAITPPPSPYVCERAPNLNSSAHEK